MNFKSNIAITATLLTLVLWFLVDYQYRRRISYDWHGFLINATNGQPIKPNELLDIERVTSFHDDYVNSTNAVDRSNDLEFQRNLVAVIELEQVYSNERDLALSGLPAADQTKCGRQLAWICDRLQENNKYALAKGRLALELTQLMDCFGKPQSALFSGLTTWTGSYERCLKTTLDHNQIKTRYCWARLKFKTWPQEQPVRPQPRIRVGVCLPETCDTTSFGEQRHQIEWLLKLELNEFYRENLELDSMFCLPDERSPIRQIGTSGRIYMGVMMCWIAVMLVGTVIYEVIRKRQRRELSGSLTERQFSTGTKSYSPDGETATTVHRIIKALSIHNSIKEFMRYNQANIDKFSRVDLRCLDMFKSLMTIMIVIGHAFYLNYRFALSIRGQYEVTSTGTATTVLSFGRFVDTFFLIFGLLATYTLMRKFKIDQLLRPSTWITFNVGVMIRLMPVYLPLYLYSKLISYQTGSGPFWDYGVYKWSMRSLCSKESTWKIIPQLASFGLNPGTACSPTAWFLVVYTQLCLVLPLFVYTIIRSTGVLRRALIIFSVCLTSGLAIGSRLAHQTTLDEDSLDSYGALMADLMVKYESFGYLSAIARAGAVAVGCYAGYLLRSYELDESYKWPRLFRSRICLLLVIAMNAFVFMLPNIGNLLRMHTSHRTTLLEFIIGNAVLSPAWCMSNAALIILATTTYRRTAIVRFAGHAFWHSMNKLGLAVFLVHWEVLWIAITGYEEGPSVGFMMDFWKLAAFGSVVAFPVAFAIYILFEAPVSMMMGAPQRRFVTREATLELEAKPGTMTDTKSAHLIAS